MKDVKSHYISGKQKRIRTTGYSLVNFIADLTNPLGWQKLSPDGTTVPRDLELPFRVESVNY